MWSSFRAGSCHFSHAVNTSGFEGYKTTSRVLCEYLVPQPCKDAETICDSQAVQIWVVNQIWYLDWEIPGLELLVQDPNLGIDPRESLMRMHIVCGCIVALRPQPLENCKNL